MLSIPSTDQVERVVIEQVGLVPLNHFTSSHPPDLKESNIQPTFLSPSSTNLRGNPSAHSLRGVSLNSAAANNMLSESGHSVPLSQVKQSSQSVNKRTCLSSVSYLADPIVPSQRAIRFSQALAGQCGSRRMI
ncbi:hypothetical protein YC2023_059844 [Brassica napus]